MTRMEVEMKRGCGQFSDNACGRWNTFIKFFWKFHEVNDYYFYLCTTSKYPIHIRLVNRKKTD